MSEILMPRLSDTMESGVIATWHKHPGDEVQPGDILAEIETDKAVMEYEAYEPGTLTSVLIEEGAEAAIGTPIAILTTADDATATVPSEQEDGAGTADRPLASPLARRDASEHGVDLRHVTGTGPGGRIIRADVLAAVTPTPTAAPPAPTPTAPVPPPPAASPAAPTAPTPGPAAASASPLPAASSAVSGVVEPLGLLRRTSGRRLAESAREIPHFTLTAVADVEDLVVLRGELNERLQQADRPKISVNDLIIRACALTLRDHPDVNSSLVDDGLLRHPDINIGVAVATAEGLLVPVIRNADRRSVSDIAAASTDLAVRARERRLRPEEMTGGTFTVSNLGMLGIEEFTAIINPPEAAILAVGAVRREPVVLDDDTIGPRTRVRYTLSADHRILDGATGARYLADLTTLLQNPWLITI
ncbi:dihydrolipoamide acetyltransferase family protein [Kribbella sp. NBC_00359]|uniref:dihydrolipoamide acetyltransferase family protein n=1 Tax=Kribbella sp. NBC_00359 TaxID=2975966 RepID=UPI002E211E4C